MMSSAALFFWSGFANDDTEAVEVHLVGFHRVALVELVDLYKIVCAGLKIEDIEVLYDPLATVGLRNPLKRLCFTAYNCGLRF
ncbi:hypothetical protein G3A39_43205 [Paraburkholderia aspalathi]|nr:hypothetical protein [Paraburkholderia aspalathi]